MVKSHGERLIADFLYLNGVDYVYERPYDVDVSDGAHSQYRPDFHYPATETARVSFPVALPATDLISVVEQAGYTAALPAPPCSEPAGREPAGAAAEDGAGETAALRQRLLASLALAIPVVALAMMPPLQFPNWQWASLALASPVAVWGAWPFHRAAAVNARLGAATMDTLISAGVICGVPVVVVYALFFGAAGRAGMRMSVAWLARGSGTEAIYLWRSPRG